MQCTKNFASPRRATPSDDAENLLSRLSVNVDSFSVRNASDEIAFGDPANGQFIVLYVVQGNGVLTWSGGKAALCKGTVAVIPAQFHATLIGGPDRETSVDFASMQDGGGSETPSLTIASALVSASAGHGLGLFERLNHPLTEASNDPLLALLFGGIITETENGGIGTRCLIETLMKQVLIVLLRRTLVHHESVNPLYLTLANPSLALVINTIRESHAERLSMPGLAGMVGMTPFKLTREFERVFGESLLDYIQGVRLAEATNLLVQTDLPIKSIAASVGFASRSHFSRTFTKRQGEDPTSFRKTNSQARLSLVAEQPNELVGSMSG